MITQNSFSGGQKQRICIACANYDEFINFFFSMRLHLHLKMKDSYGKLYLSSELEKHMLLATVKHADRIHVMERGKVIDE